jgi:phosphoribosyl 1,2-cyclic phosphate phosphodiesterase
MLRERVEKVDAILYTHEHKDHTAGLDDVRSFNFKHDMDMPLYGRESVLNQLKTEFAYIFSDKKYPGVPRVRTIPIDNQEFIVNDVKISPIEVMHYKLPVYGFRIGNFTYITDANFISVEEMEKIQGSEILVLNALRKTQHISHWNLDEAIEIANKSGAKKTYLTHLSHLMGKHSDVSKELPDHVEIAWDGLRITI